MIAVARDSFILEHFLETGEIIQSSRNESLGDSMDLDVSDV